MEKLKIGDFVRHRGDEGVFEILSIADLGDTIFYSDGNRSHREEKLKLWQPKEGEWCWFCSVNGNSELGQFIEEFFEGRYRYKRNGTNSIFNCDAVRCEPFIGKLPTFLKET